MRAGGEESVASQRADAGLARKASAGAAYNAAGDGKTTPSNQPSQVQAHRDTLRWH